MGLSAIAALALALYLVFLVVPVLLSLETSFTNQNILFPGSKFIGLGNYSRLLHDSAFFSSLEFTLGLAVRRVTVAANVIGLCFAILLNGTWTELPRAARDRVPATGGLRHHRRVRVELDAVAGRLVNNVLTATGLAGQPVNWLGTPSLARLSAAVVVSWVLSGFTTVVYLAALQNIPREMYEASAIDGASRLQQFRSITVRMVAPATTISVVISLITVLKLYDIITALTGGGPRYATRSVAMYIISVGFSDDAYGYASSIAMVLLVLTAVLALSITAVVRRREVSL